MADEEEGMEEENEEGEEENEGGGAEEEEGLSEEEDDEDEEEHVPSKSEGSENEGELSSGEEEEEDDEGSGEGQKEKPASAESPKRKVGFGGDEPPSDDDDEDQQHPTTSEEGLTTSEEGSSEYESSGSRTTTTTEPLEGRDFEKEGPGIDKKYVLEHIIGPLLKNLKSKSDKDWIMDNILYQMVDLQPDSPEYDMISELLDELLEDVVEEAEAEEEEEKETTEEYLHYLIDMYCIPHRKDPFEITYEFLEGCLHRLTDRRKELLLRGNDMMLYMHRRICDDDLKIICDFVKSRPDVITLDLAYNSITDFGMQIIADLLLDCPSLHRLNLMNNDFGAEGMQELADIADKLSLDTLRLAGNLIGVQGGIHAASLLKAKNNLLYLDVAQTSQRLQSLMDHIEALHTNDKLLYINFSRPLGEPMIGFDSGCWADALGYMLKLNSTLREIYLQKSHFICHDMERLMLCAQHNRTLYLLDLSCNNVGDHGVVVLGEYLKSRPALIVLLLAHNNIADEGGRVLHYAIPNSRLQMLDVSYNRMTDRGIMSLITTLKKPTHMRALYVWGNKITHPTLQILKRHFRAKVLDPDGMDLRIYRVDDEDFVAYYPADRYNVLYYCVPRVRFDLFHYPPKRRPPAPPDIGRVCFRLPYHWRLEPLDLRCPDTGPHARVVHAPRFCWKPRPPLPPGVDPAFMKAHRAVKRSFKEMRFMLDEHGDVVDMRPGSPVMKLRDPRDERERRQRREQEEASAAVAKALAAVEANAWAMAAPPPPPPAPPPGPSIRLPLLRKTLQPPDAAAAGPAGPPAKPPGAGPRVKQRAAKGGEEEEEEEEERKMRQEKEEKEKEAAAAEGEEEEEEEEEVEGEEEEAEWRGSEPIFTREVIVEGEPFKERRLQQDLLEGPDKPSELVEEKTREVVKAEFERKPVDGRGVMYKREEGAERPKDEFEARRAKSRGTDERRRESSDESEDEQQQEDKKRKGKEEFGKEEAEEKEKEGKKKQEERKMEEEEIERQREEDEDEAEEVDEKAEKKMSESEDEDFGPLDMSEDEDEEDEEKDDNEEEGGKMKETGELDELD